MKNMKYYTSVVHKLQNELLDAGFIAQQFPNTDIDEAVTDQGMNWKDSNMKP
jgi:hypothetical protein